MFSRSFQTGSADGVAPSALHRPSATVLARFWVGLRRVAGVATWAFAIASVLILVALAFVPRLGFYRPVTVLSGSMRPTFAPGDLLIVTPEPLREVRVGQVITYRAPVGEHEVISHRIIRILRSGDHPIIRSRGDANNAVDPWDAELHGTTAWRMRLVVPRLGHLIVWLRDPYVRALTIFLVPALLAFGALRRIWARPTNT